MKTPEQKKTVVLGAVISLATLCSVLIYIMYVLKQNREAPKSIEATDAIALKNSKDSMPLVQDNDKVHSSEQLNTPREETHKVEEGASGESQKVLAQGSTKKNRLGLPQKLSSYPAYIKEVVNARINTKTNVLNIAKTIDKNQGFRPTDRKPVEKAGVSKAPLLSKSASTRSSIIPSAPLLSNNPKISKVSPVQTEELSNGANNKNQSADAPSKTNNPAQGSFLNKSDKDIKMILGNWENNNRKLFEYASTIYEAVLMMEELIKLTRDSILFEIDSIHHIWESCVENSLQNIKLAHSEKNADTSTGSPVNIDERELFIQYLNSNVFDNDKRHLKKLVQSTYSYTAKKVLVQSVGNVFTLLKKLSQMLIDEASDPKSKLREPHNWFTAKVFMHLKKDLVKYIETEWTHQSLKQGLFFFNYINDIRAASQKKYFKDDSFLKKAQRESNISSECLLSVGFVYRLEEFRLANSENPDLENALDSICTGFIFNECPLSKDLQSADENEDSVNSIFFLNIDKFVDLSNCFLVKIKESLTSLEKDRFDYNKIQYENLVEKIKKRVYAIETIVNRQQDVLGRQRNVIMYIQRYIYNEILDTEAMTIVNTTEGRIKVNYKSACDLILEEIEKEIANYECENAYNYMVSLFSLSDTEINSNRLNAYYSYIREFQKRTIISWIARTEARQQSSNINSAPAQLAS